MAFEYSDIEDEVVTRLITYLSALVDTEDITAGYVVKQMPEKENQYDIGLNKCLLLVAYSDSTFDPPSAMDIVRQNEIVTVLINIKSPRLRGNFSIHEALKLVKMILLGYKLANSAKLFIEKIELDDRDEKKNFWSYNITFKGHKLNVEVPDEVELPNLLSVTFRNVYESPQYS